ncbi:hypothetical protein I4F81_003102 [Pyropia yezoensis]|uniref:Uncharacterized protein n=1 Tax=Pyropia yezoensis TaxID=2788 RepID=A0ACC3BRE6_PYRYE|nr:hypothetical protein I4F81_003102 [Neopyropia yezoensis]
MDDDLSALRRSGVSGGRGGSLSSLLGGVGADVLGSLGDPLGLGSADGGPTGLLTPYGSYGTSAAAAAGGLPPLPDGGMGGPDAAAARTGPGLADGLGPPAGDYPTPPSSLPLASPDAGRRGSATSSLSIPLLVRLPSGEKTQLDVPADATVDDVRRALVTASPEVPASALAEVRLEWAGQELADPAAALNDYHIADTSLREAVGTLHARLKFLENLLTVSVSMPGGAAAAAVAAAAGGESPSGSATAGGLGGGLTDVGGVGGGGMPPPPATAAGAGGARRLHLPPLPPGAMGAPAPSPGGGATPGLYGGISPVAPVGAGAYASPYASDGGGGG